MSIDRKRLIVGISGASGAIYGVTALELLRGLARDASGHDALGADHAGA